MVSNTSAGFGIVKVVILLITLLSSGLLTAEPPNDPYYDSFGSWGQGFEDQWGLKRIGFTSGEDSAWSIEDGTSNAIVVAIIDTGLDYYHPDFDLKNLWRNVDETENGLDDDGNGYVDDLIGWNFLEGNNNPWDRAGHGTFVTGIIAASINNGEGIAGINKGVKIMPLKVMTAMGKGRSSGISAAIYYAVMNGAKVINLSLGGEHLSLAENKAIGFADSKGVLVVAAAGNEAADTSEYGPAAHDAAITVAASDINDQRAGYSNWGSSVDISAPGTEILSLRARNTDLVGMSLPMRYQFGDAFVGKEAKYYRATGTSFAAPFVTGVASLILANRPELSSTQVRQMIINSAKDIGVDGIDQNTGYGLLDARSALNADPNFNIVAVISGVKVVQVEGRPAVRVLGSALADELKRVIVEIGPGNDPEQWTEVYKGRDAIESGVITEIDLINFRSAKSWSIRLRVEHRNRDSRRAAVFVKLG